MAQLDILRLLKVLSNNSRATTHTDLVLRARREGIKYKVIHNASIMNAVACCGLQVNKYRIVQQ